MNRAPHVCVLGLGYVGTVAAACLARRGCIVTGVDIDTTKVELFGRGRPSFVEEGLESLLQDAVARGRLHASDDAVGAVQTADLVVITVGTPASMTGEPDLGALETLSAQLGQALMARDPARDLGIVLRSTVPPGTTRNVFIPRIEEASGRRHGEGWSVVFAPEFLREGSAIHDFEHPPQTVVGVVDPMHAQAYLECLADLEAPIERCGLEVAELMKYACNAFHATKIAFANEVAAVAHACGANGREVMRLLCSDTVLNISSAYLRPGNAFGGSCLPKDLRGLTSLASERRVSVPLLGAVMPANDAQLERLIRAIQATRVERVGLYGLAFKAGTDDLRDSPMLRLARTLLLEGLEVRVHDACLDVERLRGRNLRFARLGLPTLEAMLCSDPVELARWAGVVVAARRLDLEQPGMRDALATTKIIDVVGQPELAGQTVLW